MTILLLLFSLLLDGILPSYVPVLSPIFLFTAIMFSFQSLSTHKFMIFLLLFFFFLYDLLYRPFFLFSFLILFTVTILYRRLNRRGNSKLLGPFLLSLSYLLMALSIFYLREQAFLFPSFFLKNFLFVFLSSFGYFFLLTFLFSPKRKRSIYSFSNI